MLPVTNYPTVLQEESPRTYYNKIRYLNEREKPTSNETSTYSPILPTIDERPKFEDTNNPTPTNYTQNEKSISESNTDNTERVEDDTDTHTSDNSVNSEGFSKFWWLLIGMPLIGVAYLLGGLVTLLLKLNQDTEKIQKKLTILSY